VVKRDARTEGGWGDRGATGEGIQSLGDFGCGSVDYDLGVYEYEWDGFMVVIIHWFMSC